MKKRKSIWPYLIAILFIIVTIFPFVWALLISIKPRELATLLPPVWNFKPTLVAYLELFTVKLMGPYLLNSVILSLLVLAVALFLGSLAAYSFARYRTGGKVLTFSILVVQMIPAMVITFPLYLLIRSIGLIDTIPGVALAQLTYSLPFVVWLMRQFFMQIPIEIDEAAKIDGASNFYTFFRIIIPISAAGFVSAAIFTFLGSWNDLLFPLMLTNIRAQTIIVAAANFITIYDVMWTDAYACAILVSVPPLLLTIFARKYIVAGLVGSSVKG